MIGYFDDELLTDFAERFYGYGNYKGAYWFVGKEEGCDGNAPFQDVKKRLSTWNECGRNELEQVASFHRKIGLGQFFDESAILQPTWNKLIRVLLRAEGRLLPTEDDKTQQAKVRDYQRTLLGLEDGENCLIELLPLPSPSTKQWIYGPPYSTLPQLINRECYKKYYMSKRAKYIRERINHYRPQVVMFYSTDQEYQYWWECIAGTPFSFDQTRKIYTARRDRILYVITPHPVTPRKGNDYFHNVGRWIASELARSEQDHL